MSEKNLRLKGVVKLQAAGYFVGLALKELSSNFCLFRRQRLWVWKHMICVLNLKIWLEDIFSFRYLQYLQVTTYPTGNMFFRYSFKRCWMLLSNMYVKYDKVWWHFDHALLTLRVLWVWFYSVFLFLLLLFYYYCCYWVSWKINVVNGMRFSTCHSKRWQRLLRWRSATC